VTRSRYVQWRSPDRQPSARIADECPAYRVATEALAIAMDLGCSGDLYDALWALCQREADAHAGKGGAPA